MNTPYTDIPGYEGLYAATTDGNIISLPRFDSPRTNVLKPFNRNGYRCVTLRPTIGGQDRHTARVHRLVALTFIPNPDNRPMVNHIDGDKTNNDISNLEWSTHAENVKHAWDTGLNVMTPKRLAWLKHGVCYAE